MSSVGTFREGETDGKPFHIYIPFFQTEIPSSSSSGELAIDSGGGDKDLEVQPLFVCLNLRMGVEELKREENGYSEDEAVPCTTPARYFPNKTSFDQQVQSVYDSYSYDKICNLPLTPNVPPDSDFYAPSSQVISCQACGDSDTCKTTFYFCSTCWQHFHKECVETPLFIKHPSYPFLSLQLNIRVMRYNHWYCFSCGKHVGHLFYHCPTYNLIMHPFCATQPITIFIDHPKRHPHSLTHFPKQNSLACNVCGLIKALIPTYICARCVFVVHQDCIYFPYVIRISRHGHRISFTYSLPSGNWFCGVCRKKVDNDCGAYSCNKCPDYYVHSRCTLRKDLWDGEELEGVPEEPEIVVEPFVTIADGIILHFSHDHHLKLEISKDYDDERFCQACVFPIYQGNYYSCMDQCDYILHEACASSPLKIYHPLHRRPLMLKVVTDEYDDNEGGFHCDACRRQSCGFVYEDPPNDRYGFKLDVRCASISEPFKYEGHEHPLFLALTPEEEELAICLICQNTGATISCRRKLNCIECDYVICFRCATLPYKARYKHDNHVLTFRKGAAGEAGDQSGWCEVCEEKIVYSGKGGFYACDDYCCTTLHVSCLLGINPYMKPGQIIDIELEKVVVRRNNTMYRPWCHGRKCGDRCIYRVLYKVERSDFYQGYIFCSYYCAESRLEDL